MVINKQPALNRQVDNFMNPLKLFAGSNHSHETVANATMYCVHHIHIYVHMHNVYIYIYIHHGN